jgi:hypothetical protein
MRTPVELLIIGAALHLVLAPANAFAQCVVFDKPQDLFAHADVVFVGTVEANEPAGAQGAHAITSLAIMRVERSWKGHPALRVRVGTDQPFERGKKFLVFASGNPLSTSIRCHAAEPVDRAKPTLEWLEKRGQDASQNSQAPLTPSTPALASPEIEAFVREALRDRLVARDFPDVSLLGLADKKPVLVRAELPASGVQITARALPSVPDLVLTLITLPEAQRIATRTGQPLHLLAIDHVRVIQSDAAMWFGVDLLVPTGLGKMCCCERDALFRKQADGWRFQRWGDEGRCY